MAKHIDADQLIKVLRRLRDKGELLIGISDVMYTIDDMPAADVAEVRHGEWVFKFYCGNMSGYDYGMNCSVCGKPTHRQFAEKMPPFCPNCGAKMDGVS